MSEFWDIYDGNKKKTGRLATRDNYEFKENEYHIAVEGVIINSKNQMLITKRAPHKRFPNKWECNGGSVLAGETSLEGMIRELKEEIGVEFSKKDAIFLKDIKREEGKFYFKDYWVFKKDVKDEEITFPDGEATDFKWVTVEEFEQMRKTGETVPVATDFTIEDFKKAIELQPIDTYKYIGNEVEVKIDRALGSMHPKHGFEYAVNYGYVPNTISGDGEELDCYVLGIDEPIQEFKGKCIAVIHRINDNDDKLIIAPNGEDFTDEQIRKLTNFQEQYFQSEIIR